MNIILQTINGFLLIYNFLIFVYILSSWIPRLRYSQIMQFVASIVEPYLAMFRSLPFSQIGMFNIAPIYGLLFLELIQQMVQNMMSGRMLKVSTALAFLVSRLGSAISGLFVLMAIITGLRLIIAFIMPKRNNIFTSVLDMLLGPAVSAIHSIFFRNKNISYFIILIISIAYFLLLSILAVFAARGLSLLLSLVPF